MTGSSSAAAQLASSGDRAGQVPTPLPNFIGGQWREVSGVEFSADTDPISGETVALVPHSGATEVGEAVRAAREAQPAWREVPPQRRARAVLDLREELLGRREELVALISADMGKTLADADGEVGRGLESVESAAAIPHLLKGEMLEGVAAGVDVELVRQPVGVVAAITPFNFPAMIPLWFLPHAIACGNCFLLKPSELDPRPAALILEAVAAVEEIPAGVVNLIHGARAAVGALLEDPGVDAISFVGRAETARFIAKAAAGAGKRVQALGGAKNSLVLMPDAELPKAVPAIIASAFGAAGQRCLAGSVCVIVGSNSRRSEVRSSLVAAARELKLGSGADPGTEICPMISAAARERVADAIERAVGEGAKLLLDGRGDAGPAGTMIGATIAAVTDTDSELAREELFGPLLALIEAADLDAALEFLNGSRYGNAGAIFTASGEAARRYRYGAEAGMLGVNVGVPAPLAWFPFAGWKDSCDGDLHANGADAVEFYTRKKVITSRW
jgi:malonate-semialdehyde dehydrogenase (acetylating) / methylmalonate-semialdehyde dehydrogenase